MKVILSLAVNRIFSLCSFTDMFIIQLVAGFDIYRTGHSEFIYVAGI